VHQKLSKKSQRTSCDFENYLDESIVEENSEESILESQVRDEIGKLIDLQEQFDDQHEDSKKWFYQESLSVFKMI